MILGFVSDAHGNPDGLERCLAALATRAERIYFLGDAVGYMPEEGSVLDMLESAGATCIRGNHEEMLLGNVPVSAKREEVYRLRGARTRLSAKHRAWLEEWPLRREVVSDGVRFLLVHGSPNDPIGGHGYPDTDLGDFGGLPHDVVVMGQTHRPFVRAAGAVEAINVGSSGMPRDVGNLASFALYDTSTRTCEILRVEFDAAAVIARAGDRIEASVADCLRRTAKEIAVGRTLHV